MAIKTDKAVKISQKHLLGIQDLSVSDINYILDESEAFIKLNQSKNKKIDVLKSPTMDKLLDKIMKSKSMKELQSITRSMDRILMAGRYVIPIYHNGPSRIAHKSNLRYPSKTPLYGDRIGFFPDVWWKAD